LNDKADTESEIGIDVDATAVFLAIEVCLLME